MATIAVFDSGIGGITFLSMARRCLPDENFIYFADTDNVPYGTRTTAEVQQLVGAAVDFLCSRAIDILVLACNTATSAAGQELRRRYPFPILGMEPALKPALVAAHPRKVLLFSTSLTKRENKLQHLIAGLEAEGRVEVVPLDELVRTAERFEFTSRRVERLIDRALNGLALDDYGAVVLGCTHFIFYRDLIRRILPSRMEILDGNQGTLNHLRNVLAAAHLKGEQSGGDVCFFSSGRPDSPARVDRLLALMQRLQPRTDGDPLPTT